MDDDLPAALAADLDRAFEALVLAHEHRLYSIALRLLGNGADAEEVTQDGFVRAYRALVTYDGERIERLELRPWLARIVVNLCRNRLRRRPTPTVPLGAPGELGTDLPEAHAGDPADGPHERLVRRDSARQWAALVLQLPERYRVPVVLRHVDGLTYEEMSKALGRPQGTLKAQVHRGLAQLRQAARETIDLDREEMTA